MLTIDVRFSDTHGNGVGRWRKYYTAEDLQEARWVVRHLVPKAQMRVRHGRTVVSGPMLVEDFRTEWPWRSLH